MWNWFPFTSSTNSPPLSREIGAKMPHPPSPQSPTPPFRLRHGSPSPSTIKRSPRLPLPFPSFPVLPAPLLALPTPSPCATASASSAAARRLDAARHHHHRHRLPAHSPLLHFSRLKHCRISPSSTACGSSPGSTALGSPPHHHHHYLASRRPAFARFQPSPNTTPINPSRHHSTAHRPSPPSDLRPASSRQRTMEPDYPLI